MTTQRETELLAVNAALEAEIVRLRNTLKGAEYTLKGFSTNLWSDDLLRNVQAAISTPFNPQALEALINKASEVATQKAMQACYDLGAKGIDYFNYASFITAIRTMPGVTLEDIK